MLEAELAARGDDFANVRKRSPEGVAHKALYTHPLSLFSSPVLENLNGSGACLLYIRALTMHALKHITECSVFHRDLEEDAKEDEEIAQMLEGTNGDPEAIRRKVCQHKLCFLERDLQAHHKRCLMTKLLLHADEQQHGCKAERDC